MLCAPKSGQFNIYIVLRRMSERPQRPAVRLHIAALSLVLLASDRVPVAHPGSATPETMFKGIPGECSLFLRDYQLLVVVAPRATSCIGLFGKLHPTCQVPFLQCHEATAAAGTTDKDWMPQKNTHSLIAPRW